MIAPPFTKFIASQTLLSGLQIPYDLNLGLPTDQPHVNAAAGSVLLSYWAGKNPAVYQSPAILPLPSTLPGLVLTEEQIADGVTIEQAIKALAEDPDSQYTPEVAAAMAAATANYDSLYTSGNLKLIHAAVDQINALLPLTKQPSRFVPYSDLQTLQNCAGVIGQFAQQCGSGQPYFPYYPAGPDPATEKFIQDAYMNGQITDPRLLPTVFFS
jgi:hypothetical protein